MDRNRCSRPNALLDRWSSGSGGMHQSAEARQSAESSCQQLEEVTKRLKRAVTVNTHCSALEPEPVTPHHLTSSANLGRPIPALRGGRGGRGQG